MPVYKLFQVGPETVAILFPVEKGVKVADISKLRQMVTLTSFHYRVPFFFSLLCNGKPTSLSESSSKDDF